MSKSLVSRSTLSALVESDSDDVHYDEQSTMITSDSGAENMVPPKKGGRGKAAVTKITKAKKSPAKKGRRPALKDRTNAQASASDTEEVDDFEEQEDTTINETMMSVDELEASVVPIPKPNKSRPTKAKAPAKSTKKSKANSTNCSIDDDIPVAPQHESKPSAASKKTVQRKRQRQAEPEYSDKEIPETQVAAMDIDDHGDEEIEEPTPKPIVRKTTRARSTSHSRQPSVVRHRAGSVSDTERHDPALRRKVGDLTKKLENLELKYRNLREVGIQEAEDNFEKYKRQSEESKKAANSLIATLKGEINNRDVQLKESQALKKRLEAQEVEISNLQAKLAQLSTSLSEAQTENKTLSTKLAANRTAAASVESINAKAPGSAVKAAGTIRLMGSAEAAQAAQAAQLKEDLYADLTGLIIRGVKREEEEDVFDCIQIGRNGTLHFKFAVANDKGVDGYDDAQCQYIPQLDPSRDKALKDLLPDYLIDEIVFPRLQVEKFYSRVVKALTERPT